MSIIISLAGFALWFIAGFKLGQIDIKIKSIRKKIKEIEL